jgi:hypothetical protein
LLLTTDAGFGIYPEQGRQTIPCALPRCSQSERDAGVWRERIGPSAIF